jgi:glutamate synthase (NADPH/NADH) large chain
MMRKCHLNTCPVGIATQDPELRKKFQGTPEHVVNYMFMIAREVRQIMAQLGLRRINDMVGRVDLLQADAAVGHWKAKGLDLTDILTPAQIPSEFLGSYAQHQQDHNLDRALDNKLMELAEPAINNGEHVTAELDIVNTNRVVGAMLSNKIIREVGPEMLPDDSIHFKFNGSAGQSFGCWLARGVTLEVEGDANDYTGKGLSGGKIIIYPPKVSVFKPEENILVGNVSLYGATSGEAYFRGMAAERFCVRNSGASAVIEGVGDHGCEYMTGGRVAILGPTGRNFAAGMSGGIAYIWDPSGQFATQCNMEMVALEQMEEDADMTELKHMIKNHKKYTGSTVAADMLENWQETVLQFVKVMPTDFKRVLQAREQVSAG